MSDPRTRRLVAEHDSMRAAFLDHPHVQVQPIGWHPADCYRLTYQVPGVVLDASGQPVLVQEHVVVITTGETYPRDRPATRVETGLFHPNVSTDASRVIDTGELWTAQRTLVDLVLQLGAIIQLQEYDLDVPLNPIAARWVAENQSIFPVGHVSLRVEVDEAADEASGAVSEDEPAHPAVASGPVEQSDPAGETSEQTEPDRPYSVWAPPDPTAS